jgi:hypothetical protein
MIPREKRMVKQGEREKVAKASNPNLLVLIDYCDRLGMLNNNHSSCLLEYI